MGAVAGLVGKRDVQSPAVSNKRLLRSAAGADHTMMSHGTNAIDCLQTVPIKPIDLAV